jgi:hypothetical protein
MLCRLFGDGDRLLPFLDQFLQSPILKSFGWSTLVNNAVESNARLFAPSRPTLSFLPYSKYEKLSPDQNTPIPGLLALHIRKGDYREHCKNLAGWHSTYMGWLRNPALPDHFDIPPNEDLNLTTIEDHARNRELRKQYMSHCWPTDDEIVEKITEVRESRGGEGLKRVYILTNGRPAWVAGLKDKIRRMGGWERVSSSRDLTLTPEQRLVGQAIDMSIAMRSEVFIGNGVS